jgi:hypothetical protein
MSSPGTSSIWKNPEEVKERAEMAPIYPAGRAAELVRSQEPSIGTVPRTVARRSSARSQGGEWSSNLHRLTTKRPILLEQAKRRGGWASIFLSFSRGDVR